MSGKLFLLAFACASFVQVWASSERDEKISKAWYEVYPIIYDAEWVTQQFTLYSEYTLVEYKAENEKYLREKREYSAKMYAYVEKEANSTKEEAKASNKPQSVFSCIDEVREKMNEKIEKHIIQLTTTITSEQSELEKKWKRVNNDSRALHHAVSYEQKYFYDRIYNTKEIKDIDVAVEYYKIWWRHTTYAWLEKMISDFDDYKFTYHEKVSPSICAFNAGMKNVSDRTFLEMRNCLENKQAIFGKSILINNKYAVKQRI